MSKVFPGRYTAEIDDPFVVFLIGMRVNNIFAVRKWVPTARAMTKMLRVLDKHPEKGFMGAEAILYWRGIGLVQYWRSFDDLERFARSPSEPHIETWRHFNKTIGSDGTVGFWHETYLVEPGKHEAVYGNMPVFGLAAAAKHVPAVGRRETARRRLGGENEPAVSVSGHTGRRATLSPARFQGGIARAAEARGRPLSGVAAASDRGAHAYSAR